MNNIFRIKKEERLFALITLIVIIAFNVLMITYHFDDFGKPKAGFWTLFTKNFQISGFDPYTYLTLSKWKVYYTEYRHPMLPFFLYPFSLLNGWLIELTSRNWATTIVAVMMTFFSTYSTLFFRRIFREVMQLKAIDSNVLTAMLFSFAYVLLVTFVDDHFGMSLFFLSMTLYIAGKQQKEHQGMPWWQTALLFFFTAGITLSNGAKTFLAALFTNGKKLFRPKYLALGIILPTLLIGATGIYQNKAFIIPNRLEGERLVAQKAAKDSTFRAKMEQKQKHDKAIAGKNIQKRGMLSWADMSISRSESLVEKRFWRIAYPAQRTSSGRYPQPPPDIREIPDTRSLYHRGYHRDSAVYGLLDGKKIGLSLAHSLMGGMRCLHSSGHGIRTERGLYHGCPLGVHHSGLYRIYHQKL